MKLPRYLLRTMLIAVAIIAAGVGYVAQQARIVAQRKAFLDRHGYLRYGACSDLEEIPGVPWIHRCLGAEPVWILTANSPEEIATAKQLFPEASVTMRNASTNSTPNTPSAD
jgi:hypothetical protein